MYNTLLAVLIPPQKNKDTSILIFHKHIQSGWGGPAVTKLQTRWVVDL